MKLMQYLKAPLSRRLQYEIPDEYHNSFYLANASLLQILNYYIHKSYQQVFPELLIKLVTNKQGKQSDEEAASTLKTFIKRLDRCDCFVDLHIPLKRRHGELQIVRANRAYHGISLVDTSMGGIRFEQNLTRHNSQGFSALATYKHALLGLDVAGAHGGFQANPNTLEEEEINTLLREYLMRLGKFGNLKDVLQPNRGCGSKGMDHISQFLKDDLTSHIYCVGKSDTNGGFKECSKISAKSAINIIKGFMCNKEICGRLQMDGPLKEKTFIVEGLENDGKQIALALCNEGSICVGVKDEDCMIYDPSGIPLKAMLKHRNKYGTIRSFSSKSREHELDKIYTHQCDILVLAALERVITCNLADRMQAKIILEASDLPVTPTADKILCGKSRLIIPDLLVAVSETLLSHYEFTGKHSNDLNKINEEINSTIKTLIDDILKTEKELNLNFNFRSAAYIKGIRYLFDRHVLAKAEQLNEKAVVQ